MAEKKIKVTDSVENKFDEELDNLSVSGNDKGLTDINGLKTRPIALPIAATSHTSPFPLNRIVFGAPGTGKSKMLDDDKNLLLKKTAGTYERVTFYPEYSYSQFVGCYKPVSIGGKIDYKFVPGPFIRVLVEALKTGRTKNPQPHLLLIEEINRAKPAAVFGDLFQLLDRDSKTGASQYVIHTSEDVKRYLADPNVLGGIPDNYEELFIPNNMYIWASMNSADQGVQPMDTAFKRRWSFEYISVNKNQFDLKNIHLGNSATTPVNWNSVRKAINDALSIEFGINEDKLLGPYFISGEAIERDKSNAIKNESLFNAEFRSKVLMYLFEDAGRRCRQELFKGCSDTSKYSAILEEFDLKGIEIFGDNTSAFGKHYKP